MSFENDKVEFEDKKVFVCKKCGDCCKGYGGTFLDDQDIQRISEYVKVDPHDFVEKYCQFSGGKPLLAQKEDGYCIFWDSDCKIHPVKPRMCRDWPFIKSLLVDPANWRVVASMCSGASKNADLHLVLSHVRRMNPDVSTP